MTQEATPSGTSLPASPSLHGISLSTFTRHAHQGFTARFCREPHLHRGSHPHPNASSGIQRCAGMPKNRNANRLTQEKFFICCDYTGLQKKNSVSRLAGMGRTKKHRRRQGRRMCYVFSQITTLETPPACQSAGHQEAVEMRRNNIKI